MGQQELHEFQQFLPQGRNNPRYWCMLGAGQLESNFAKKDLRVLVNTKLNVSWQQTFLAKKDTSLLGCIRQSTASNLSKVIPSTQHW